jgi:hypothetical protein
MSGRRNVRSPGVDVKVGVAVAVDVAVGVDVGVAVSGTQVMLAV